MMKQAFLSLVALMCLSMLLPALPAVSPAIAQTVNAANSDSSGNNRGVRAYDEKKRTLNSTARPAVNIKFRKEFKYLGSQSFTLYNVAHAEQHFFVEADEEKRILRLYWVQFEGYLPTNSHAYNYKANQTAKIGGYDFIADSRALNLEAAKAQQRPDSDGARARAFLESKGYRMATDDVLMQRLVHILDATRRDELMIIYMEDLGGSGLIAEDLAVKGKAEKQWGPISLGLLQRAVSGIEIKKN